MYQLLRSGIGAINEPMVARQRERQHHARLEGLVDEYGGVRGPRKAEDRDFGMVQMEDFLFNLKNWSL